MGVLLSMSALVLLSCIGSVVAAPIAGTFTFGGTAIVGSTFLDMKGPGEIAGFGRVDLGDINTGSFATLNAIPDAKATLKDRNSLTEPADIQISVPNYLVIDDLPEFFFTLTFIQPGRYGFAECFDPPASAQQCTPEIFFTPEPYNFSNFTNAKGGLSSSGSFTVEGTVVNFTDPSMPPSSFLGTFTFTINNEPYQLVLASLLSGGTRAVLGGVPGHSDRGTRGHNRA